MRPELLPHPDDEAGRIARAADGDEAARAWLVRRWTTPLFRFALRMLGDEQDAHDAAQDTLVKVLRALPSYDPSRSFATWIYGIARNTCIDQHRKRWRRSDAAEPEVVDPGPTPAQAVLASDRDRRVLAALQGLPPLYRDVLVLYHYEHLKYAEIAELLQIPLGTVMNRIFRARARLRDALDAQGFEP